MQDFLSAEDQSFETALRLAFLQQQAQEEKHILSQCEQPLTVEEEQLSERMFDQIPAMIQRERRIQNRLRRTARWKKAGLRFVKAAACVIAVMAVCFTVAFACSAAVREAVSRLFVHIDEEKGAAYISFSKGEEAVFASDESWIIPTVPEDWPGEYYMAYIPEGFNISWQAAFDVAMVSYTDSNGRRIDFSENDEDSVAVMGTEGATVSNLTILDKEATVIEANIDVNGQSVYYIQIIWANDEKWFMLDGYGLEKDIILQICAYVNKISK